MKWFIGVIVTVIVQLSDTQPPDGSREPGEGRRTNRGGCACCGTVEPDACQTVDIFHQQDTQAQAPSKETEAGNAAQAQAACGDPASASFDDRHLSAEEVDEQFVRELMDRWGGQTFFLTEKDLEELETMYLTWRGSQSEKTPLYDKDICCETNNNLQRECGKMSDVEGKEWFVMCPIIGGKRYVQCAEVGTCVLHETPCMKGTGTGVCRVEKKAVSLWSRPPKKTFKRNEIQPRLFPVNGYCSCKSN